MNKISIQIKKYFPVLLNFERDFFSSFLMEKAQQKNNNLIHFIQKKEKKHLNTKGIGKYNL